MPGERVFVGLGSNLADPVAQVSSALRALDRMPRTRLLRASSLYLNPPMGPPEQPHYVNAVAELATALAPLALLERLLDLERSHGRARPARRWHARVLDLDLLLYGERRIHEQRLSVPHPGLHTRAFVVHPLAEIAPAVVVPGHGPVADLARRVPACGLVRVQGPPACVAG